MSVPLPNRMEEVFYDEFPFDSFESHTSARRPSDLGLFEGRCDCNCSCGNSDENDNGSDDSGASSPSRGRSRTPKYDRTNGNGQTVPARPTPNDTNLPHRPMTDSVNGQEGLADYQFEGPAPRMLNDPEDDEAFAPIQRWLSQNPDQADNPFCFPGSPEASMLVEASTASPSLASSGFLLPTRAASSGDLMAFATGGFDEGPGSAVKKAQLCAFTPLWLTHERRYCRNMHFGAAGKAAPRYPTTLDFDDR